MDLVSDSLKEFLNINTDVLCTGKFLNATLMHSAECVLLFPVFIYSGFLHLALYTGGSCLVLIHLVELAPLDHSYLNSEFR